MYIFNYDISLESLGNKAILEKRINIRASDYKFADKVKYYQGYINSRKQAKEGTKNQELLTIADTATDFCESDITKRHDLIIDSFVNYLAANNLIK